MKSRLSDTLWRGCRVYVDLKSHMDILSSLADTYTFYIMKTLLYN